MKMFVAMADTERERKKLLVKVVKIFCYGEGVQVNREGMWREWPLGD